MNRSGEYWACSRLEIAFVLAMRSAQMWEIVWRWLHSVNFDVTDRVFDETSAFTFSRCRLFEELVRLGLALCFFSGVGSLAPVLLQGHPVASENPHL